MSADKQDAMRVALHSMGIPIEDEWTIQEVSLKRDIDQVDVPDVDVYGNKHTEVSVVGQQITIVVYRPEN